MNVVDRLLKADVKKLKNWKPVPFRLKDLQKS